jgi:hypothetical protein
MAVVREMATEPPKPSPATASEPLSPVTWCQPAIVLPDQASVAFCQR